MTYSNQPYKLPSVKMHGKLLSDWHADAREREKRARRNAGAAAAAAGVVTSRAPGATAGEER